MQNDMTAMMIDDARNLLRRVLVGEEVDVVELRRSIDDLQSVLNEVSTKITREDPMIYKFSDYYKGPDDFPPRAA